MQWAVRASVRMGVRSGCFVSVGRPCDAVDFEKQFLGNLERWDAVGSERWFFWNFGRNCDAEGYVR